MRLLASCLLIAASATPALAAPAPAVQTLKAAVRVERPRHRPVMEVMIGDRGLTALLSDRGGQVRPGQTLSPVPQVNGRR